MNMWAVVICIVFIFGFSASADAQAFRTWVSGVGDDVNPCARTAPCKTFAGAVSKTAPGGEVNVLESSGFGSVTITKSITIDGAGAFASILAASGTTGIVVNAGPTDVVTIRNLSIDGVGTGLVGIRFVSGKALNIENVKVFGFTGDGIEVSKTASGALNIMDSSISHCGGTGVRIASSAGAVWALIGHSRVQNCGFAIQAGANAVLSVRDSDLYTNNIAVVVDGGNAQASLFDVHFGGNGVGITARAGVTRIIGNTFFNNGAGIDPAGGSICSTGNNRFAGNGKNGSPSASGGACSISTQ